MKTSRIWTVLLLCIIALGFGVRSVNPFLFSIANQHGPEVHWPCVKAYYHGQLPDTAIAPFAYMWYALWARIVSLFVELPWVSLLRVAIGLGNMVFFLVFLTGVYNLAVKWRFSLFQRLCWLAAVCGCVPLQRMFNMVRPEVLQLALTPWLFFWAFSWWDEVCGRGFTWRSEPLWTFLLVAPIVMVQKVGGIFLVGSIFLVLLCATRMTWSKRFMALFKAGLVLSALFASLVLAWYASSGWWVFQHNRARISPAYHHRAPPCFYLKLPLARMVRHPLRDQIKDSMWGIALLDLYGDYWRYGYSARKTASAPAHQLRAMETPAWLPWRNRMGLAAALLFVGLVWTSALLICRQNTRESRDVYEEQALWTWLLTPVAMFGYLILASQTQFNPTKADIMKWAYIVMATPMLSLPWIIYLGRLRDNDGSARFTTQMVLFILLCCIGLYQALLA